MFPSTLVQYKSTQLALTGATKDAIESIVENSKKMIPLDVEELESRESLDILIPPRVLEKDGQFWYQKVSRSSASSSDILRLQDQLDEELLRREAREMGLCPARSEIYDECFEELVRQEAITCPERGRLLRMIQLEARLSQSSAQKGYESALAYGLKKKLLSAREVLKVSGHVTELLNRVGDLENSKRDLEVKASDIKREIEAREAEKEAGFEADQKKFRDENEEMLGELMQCVDISIQVENEQPAPEVTA